MSKHIHAELMAQYAQDAMETDKPHCLWQWKDRNHDWSDIFDHPSWHLDGEYRRKPKTYEPTLLDQALELEIEALRLRINYYVNSTDNVLIYRGFLDSHKARRTPEMIEHLKQQGKL